MTALPIIIVGGGLSGLAMAAVLAARGYTATLLDSGDGGGGGDVLRTTTLNPFAYDALIGVGIDMDGDGCKTAPVMSLQVDDESKAGDAEMRGGDAPLLGWQSDDDAPLARVVRNSALVDALDDFIAQKDSITIHRNTTITGLAPNDNGLGLCLTDEGGKVWEAGLVLAADGARSALREMAGIKTISRDPGQIAIVADVITARPHGDTAWQRFCRTGTLALMPLAGEAKAMSLVWTLAEKDAEEYMAEDDAAFNRHLTATAIAPFGALALRKGSARRHFPVKPCHAVKSFGVRLALIGDAAHNIHPLAGQGFNLAMGDIMALAASLDAARRTGSDYGSDAVLKRYGRKRAAEVAAMTLATDGLNYAFSSASPAIRSGVASAMAVFDRTPLKNLARDFAARGFNI